MKRRLGLVRSKTAALTGFGLLCGNGESRFRMFSQPVSRAPKEKSSQGSCSACRRCRRFTHGGYPSTVVHRYLVTRAAPIPLGQWQLALDCQHDDEIAKAIAPTQARRTNTAPGTLEL